MHAGTALQGALACLRAWRLTRIIPAAPCGLSGFQAVRGSLPRSVVSVVMQPSVFCHLKGERKRATINANWVGLVVNLIERRCRIRSSIMGFGAP